MEHHHTLVLALLATALCCLDWLNDAYQAATAKRWFAAVFRGVAALGLVATAYDLWGML